MWVIITGANGGIGEALCRVFHTEGYNVLATDLQPQPLHNFHKLYFEMDLEELHNNELYRQKCSGYLKNTVASDGLKALINNGAIQKLNKIEKITTDDWNSTLAVNILAPFWLTQMMLPLLEKSDGSVINVSSIHERLTKPEFTCYATSKAALSGLTRALVNDIGSRIRINAISPAAIQTPMLEAGFVKSPKKLKKLKDCHPSKNIGMPIEVAELALFLTTSKSHFINGSVITIDGGISATLHEPN